MISAVRSAIASDAHITLDNRTFRATAGGPVRVAIGGSSILTSRSTAKRICRKLLSIQKRGRKLRTSKRS